jgi:hypothetical protein
MADTEKITYATEAEKNAALEEIQDKPGGATEADFELIDRIGAAEVTEKPNPADDLVIEDEAKPPNKSEEKPEPAPKTLEDETRNWQITEEMISEYDDEYFDGQKQRKFITHKNPGDFLKSYVGAQKNNHYLKTQKIPQAQQEGYNKAKAEYETKLQAYEKELETLKAKPPEKKETITPVETDTLNQYKAVVEELNGISDEDSVEHTATMKKALILSQKLRDEENARYAADINSVRSEVNNKLVAFETKQEEKDRKRLEALNLETDRTKQQTIINRIYNEIDSFVASKDAPPEAKTDQPFSEMHAEAMTFHNELAEAYTGNSSGSYSQQEWNGIMEKAGTAYLNSLPELVAKAKAIGINEPKNYKQWVFLDNLDATRTGMMRDPVTNEWVERFSTTTGKKINLGDIKTAYNYYLDNSGLREKKISDDKKADAEKLVHAINKRDGGVTQLDDSKMTGEGEGQALTKDKAREIVENLDWDFIKAEEMRGNLEPLQKANAAIKRLDGEPVSVLLEK